MLTRINTILLICLLLAGAVSIQAQPIPVVADEIAATIGSKILLRSEIDLEAEQQKKQATSLETRCDIFNQLLIRKFMLMRADLDSVEIPDDRIDAELNKRVRYFVSMYGNEKKMEETLGKTIAQLKSENREKIREELLIQQQREKLVGGVKVSPKEVSAYYNKFPKDSLPNFDAEIEVAQIVRKPKVTDEEKQIAYQKILDIRNQILNGTSFRAMALIYSDDKSSARNGGEMDEFGRGDMVPQFEVMAFRMQPDSISPIIETMFGYHILQLLYRKGDRVKVRHILIRPTLINKDYELAKHFLDSLRQRIVIDSIKFEDAAQKYSDDEGTSFNGGFFVDPNTGSTRIPVSILDKETYESISKLKVGEISQPMEIQLDDGSTGYRMFYLKTEVPPHVMNLKDDYQKIQARALEVKQFEVLKKWLAREKNKIYYNVRDEYKECLSKSTL